MPQAIMNDTAGTWQAAPPALPLPQRTRVTPGNLALWAVASLLAYCVYEQLRFMVYRCFQVVGICMCMLHFSAQMASAAVACRLAATTARCSQSLQAEGLAMAAGFGTHHGMDQTVYVAQIHRSQCGSCRLLPTSEVDDSSVCRQVAGWRLFSDHGARRCAGGARAARRCLGRSTWFPSWAASWRWCWTPMASGSDSASAFVLGGSRRLSQFILSHSVLSHRVLSTHCAAQCCPNYTTTAQMHHACALAAIAGTSCTEQLMSQLPLTCRSIAASSAQLVLSCRAAALSLHVQHEWPDSVNGACHF